MARLQRSPAYIQFLEDRTLLSTIVAVDTFADVVNAGDGVTSLREAILEANSVAGDYEIQLAAGTYTLSLSGEDENAAATGDLDILANGSVTLIGAGDDQTTIDANGLGDRIFHVNSGASFSVQGVTLTGGSESDGAGGAILANTATLEIIDSTLTDNTVGGTHGGGVYAFSSQVTVTGSTFNENIAEFSGGALFGWTSQFDISDSTFCGNVADEGFGGAISGTFETNFTITGSTFSGNRADVAGGAFAAAADSVVSITSSSLLNNTSLLSGGAIHSYGNATFTILDSTIAGNVAGFDGGGINAVEGSDIFVTNSTISGNQADRSGGGIIQTGNAGVVEVAHSTITGNRANADGMNGGGGGGIRHISGSFTLHNSIVAGNLRGTTTGNDDMTNGTDLEAGSHYNLIGHAGSAGNLVDGVNGNIVGVGGTGVRDIVTIIDPTLSDNGGPTATHAIFFGSPAANAGDPGFDPADFTPQLLADQRDAGFDRVVDGRIDIGAVEASSIGVTTFDDIVDDFDGLTSLREAVIYASNYPGGFEIRLAAGTYTLSIPAGEEDGPEDGDLDIFNQSNVTIIGAGAGQTIIDATALEGLEERAVEVHDSATLNLQGLTITGGFANTGAGGGIYNHGSLTLHDVAITGNSSDNDGGGIYNNGGTVVIADSTISDNIALTGGGIYNTAGGSVTITGTMLTDNDSTGNSFFYGGGAIHNDLLSDLDITSSTISGNTAVRRGGGIYSIEAGLVTIDDTTISMNTGFEGGGIYNRETELELSGSTLADNGTAQASLGGGIHNEDSQLTAVDTDFTGNKASKGGGIAVYGNSVISLTGGTFSMNAANIEGGAIFNLANGQITTNGTNFEDNTAAGNGGGIHTSGGSLTINGGEFTGNMGESGGGVYSNTSVEIADALFHDNEAGTTGGGVLSVGEAASLNIARTTFSENTAHYGAGLTNTNDSTAMLTDVMFLENNNTGGPGAAVYNNNRSTLSITDGTISGNSAVGNNGSGAGFANYSDSTLTITNSTITGNTTTTNGGAGIDNSSGGTVTVTGSTISGNRAGIGDNATGSGGGIRSGVSSSRVEIIDSTVSENSGFSGGGILNIGGSTMVVTRSNIIGNTSTGTPSTLFPNGGGISSVGILEITESTISGNMAENFAGGVHVSNGTAVIVGSTISHNSAGREGGGVHLFNGGEVEIYNSTLSGNQARDGGGIYALNYSIVNVTHGTITGNRSDADGGGLGSGGGIHLNLSTVTLNNTIVAGNFRGTGATADDVATFRQDLDPGSSHSLIGDAATAGGLSHGVNGNIVGNAGSGTLDITTLLDTRLRNNGGTTNTHALVAGSLAIDSGDDLLAIDVDDQPLVHDQRGAGFNRLIGTHVDMGAFEFNAADLSEVGDWVWNDANRNGIQDDGEAGLRVPGGITVRLYTPGPDAVPGGDDDLLYEETTTNKWGVYRFQNVIAGDYFVEFVLPGPGFAFTGFEVGNWKKDSNADPGTGRTTVFVVGSGETDLTRDAGMLEPGRIGDRVWVDDNGDGELDSDEPGIRIPGGMTVLLFDAGSDQQVGGGDDVQVDSVQTNKWGGYQFDNVAAGKYYVQFVLPDGFLFTQQEAPGVNWKKNSDANRDTGRTSVFNLTANKADVSRDAGLIANARVAALPEVPPTESSPVDLPVAVNDGRNAFRISSDPLATAVTVDPSATPKPARDRTAMITDDHDASLVALEELLNLRGDAWNTSPVSRVEL